MQNAETVLSVLRERHGIVAGEPGDQKWSRRVREGGLGKGPQGTSPRPYLSRSDRRNGARGHVALLGRLPGLRRADQRAQGKGDAYAYCKRCRPGAIARDPRAEP